MNARPRHILKFVEHYASTYPTTPILHLTSNSSDFFFNTSARQRAEFTPAINVIVSQLSETNRDGLILMHALSNGGGAQVALLSKHFRETQGEPLPAGALIMDSLPGKAKFWQGLALFSQGLPKFKPVRFLLQLFLGLLLCTFYIVPEKLGRKSHATMLRDYLNSEDYLPKYAKRCYIYSMSDRFVSAVDVQQHLDEAKAKGLMVETVCFEDSGHVEHMRMYPKTYWKAVQRAWEMPIIDFQTS